MSIIQLHDEATKKEEGDNYDPDTALGVSFVTLRDVMFELIDHWGKETVLDAVEQAND